MDNLLINHENYQTFYETCKNLSKRVFEDYTSCDADILEVERELIIKSVLKNQMSFILLSCSDYNIIFKSMFSITSLKGKLSQFMSLPLDKVSDSLVNDYMNEYCNLFAGNLKKILQFNFKSDVGISIPLISSGFEAFYFGISKRNTIYFYWKVKEESFDIICSLEFESLKGFTLDQLNTLNLEVDKKETDFFDF
jgi:hypothetical protein